MLDDRHPRQPSPARSASARERERSPAFSVPRPRVGGRPRTEHDPRTMAKLAALHRDSASIRRIAGELGLSATTVARLVRDQGTPPIPSPATEVA